MKKRLKERVVDAMLVLAFLAVIATSAYLIIKMMTRWTVKGLG